MQALMELKLRIQVNFRIPNLFEPDDVIILIENSWTHVKEIPSTTLLVTLHHKSRKSANMTVFDISKKDQIQEIYSLGEVSGGKIIF